MVVRKRAGAPRTGSRSASPRCSRTSRTTWARPPRSRRRASSASSRSCLPTRAARGAAAGAARVAHRHRAGRPDVPRRRTTSSSRSRSSASAPSTPWSSSPGTWSASASEPGLHRCRGVLAAQAIKPQARMLAEVPRHRLRGGGPGGPEGRDASRSSLCLGRHRESALPHPLLHLGDHRLHHLHAREALVVPLDQVPRRLLVLGARRACPPRPPRTAAASRGCASRRR